MSRRAIRCLYRPHAYALCAIIGAPTVASSAEFQVRDLGSLGGRFTVATDLNASGQVTGYSETTEGQVHAFLYRNGEMQDLGTLGGAGSLSDAINDVGQVTGFALTAKGEAHAFVPLSIATEP